ncbi:MAG: ImmA/IrrE family metallo-endopeptidase [Oscillospiraceae bacterium]|nr:ImmA/IrrE family metallo-endopeptidase [Oscillospiraceae bacterium]
MKLSYNDIENIAKAELYKFMSPAIDVKGIRPIIIGTFASSYLRLQVKYTRLSDYGKVLGLTTYADTDIILNRYCNKDKIFVPAKTILIDESLSPPGIWNIYDKASKQRQFTIAHECAHQILYRRMPEDERKAFDKKYSKRTMTIQELTTVEDWLEWQANALAAALIMPKKYIELLLGNRQLFRFGNRMNKTDNLLFRNIGNRLGVSQLALTLRLKQLGYLHILPASEYFCASDIECDDDLYLAEQEIGVQANARCS